MLPFLFISFFIVAMTRYNTAGGTRGVSHRIKHRAEKTINTHHQVTDRLAQGAVELPPLDVQRHIVVAVGHLHHRGVVLIEAGVVHGVPAEL